VQEIVPNFDPFAVARVCIEAENSAQRFGERERERTNQASQRFNGVRERMI